MKKRIVLKVGSSILTDKESISIERLTNLVNFIGDLKDKNYDVLLVSSGAVSAGFTVLPLDRTILANKQALSSIGQPLLLSKYQEAFSKINLTSSQILLSSDVFDCPDKIKHAKTAIDKLLENNVIPIINENDTVSVEELVFGDNDMLSAHITKYFDAEQLIILSDVDALYIDDPKKYSQARTRPLVFEILDSEISEDKIKNIGFGTGGIVTKLRAGRFILENNLSMLLTSGLDLTNIRSYLLDNDPLFRGTIFKR